MPQGSMRKCTAKNGGGNPSPSFYRHYRTAYTRPQMFLNRPGASAA
jgi:hypothetical protein